MGLTKWYSPMTSVVKAQIEPHLQTLCLTGRCKGLPAKYLLTHTQVVGICKVFRHF